MKTISIFCISLLLSLSVLAQSHHNHHGGDSYKTSNKATVLVGFDLVPSLNFISTSTQGYKSSSVSLGLKPILYVDILMTKNIALSAGLAYSTKGGNIKYQQNTIIEQESLSVDGEVTSSYTISYIDIPLMLKAFTNPVNDWSFKGGIGISPGFRALAKVENKFTNLHYENLITGNDFEGTLMTKHNVQNEVNLFELSADIRLAAEYHLGERTALTMGLYGNMGLLNSFKKANANSETKFKGNLYQFGIFLGIVF